MTWIGLPTSGGGAQPIKARRIVARALPPLGLPRVFRSGAAHTRGVRFGMGFGELVLLLVVVVVVFGATKLPYLGGGLGDSIQRRRDQQRRGDRLHLVFRDGRSRPWTFFDWLLVLAAVALGAIVV